MKPSLRLPLLACSLLLFVLQFAVYLPALNNAFVHYDDNTYVYENKNIKALNAETVSGMFARPYFRSYTPVALLSHAIDYAIWAEKPFGHHLTSLILHSINVVLVFLLGSVLPSKNYLLEKIPFFLLSIGFGLLAMWAAQHGLGRPTRAISSRARATSGTRQVSPRGSASISFPQQTAGTV